MKKNMINKMITAVMLLAAVVLTSSCYSNADNGLWWSEVMTIHGEGVANHAVTMELGQSIQLSTASIEGGVDWKSDNESVAFVSESGLLSALSLGEALVTVYPKEIEAAANGNYINVTVVDVGFGFVDDALDQSEAE